MFEQKIVNYPEYVNIKGTEIILKQMKKSICKINAGNGKSGTGFFCYIPYQYKELKVLITNYHIIDENYIKNENNINLGINDNENYMNISLEKNKKIFLSEHDDLAIIEINDKEYLNNINFLELDKRLLNEKSEKTYSSENSIYIVHFPNANEASVSYAILDYFEENKIIHKCSTEKGSSGSPILNLKTKKVIGVHQGAYKNLNIGIFLKNAIQNLNNKMKKIGEIKNNNNNNNKSNNFNNYNNFINYTNNNHNNYNNHNPNIFKIKNIFKGKSNNSINNYKKEDNKKQKEDFNKGSLDIVNQNKIEIKSGKLMNINGYGINLGTNISCQPKAGELNQQFQFKIPQKPEIKYFLMPSYTGGSIVDALKSIGEESSFEYRAIIATMNGIVNRIQDYRRENNENENIKMLKLLMEGKLIKP